MKRNIFFASLIIAIITGCGQQRDSSTTSSSNDSVKRTNVVLDSSLLDPYHLRPKDSKSVDDYSSDSVRKALWTQYDSISDIRKGISDSLRNCKTRDEKYFYNVCDGKLDHMQSAIMNNTNGILLADLKKHSEALDTVIEQNSGNLKRIEKFTRVLGGMSKWICRTVDVATFLIGRGILKPKIPSPVSLGAIN